MNTNHFSSSTLERLPYGADVSAYEFVGIIGSQIINDEKKKLLINKAIVQFFSIFSIRIKAGLISYFVQDELLLKYHDLNDIRKSKS